MLLPPLRAPCACLALLATWLVAAGASHQNNALTLKPPGDVDTQRARLVDYMRDTRRKNQDIKRFVVEFAPDTHHQAITHVSSMVAQHIEGHGYVVQTTHTYDDPEAFWGATYHVSPATSHQAHSPHRVISRFQDAPKVVNVWPDYQRRLHSDRMTYRSKTHHGAVPKKHGAHGSGNAKHHGGAAPSHHNAHGSGNAKHHGGAAPSHHNAHGSGNAKHHGQSGDTFPPHLLTGIAQAHAQGHLGQGAVICHADSGVDYSVPGLNAGHPPGVPCIGPHCQVIGGRDFIAEPYDGKAPREGPLRYKDVQYPDGECWHGTHTAGSMIASGTKYGFTGVAPLAKLRHYKVFGCTSINPVTNKTEIGIHGGYLSTLIGAYLRGKKEGCNIMSLSIGGDPAYGKDAEDLVVARLSKQIAFVISNGNSGETGFYTGEDPGGVESVITAAAGYADASAAWPFWLDSDPKHVYPGFVEIPLRLNVTKDTAYPIYFTPRALKDAAVPNDGCNVTKGSVPNLKGHVVIVFRSNECGWQQLIPFYDAGARVVLAISNYREAFNLGAFNDDLPGLVAAELRREDGQAIREAYLKSKGKVKVVFPGKPTPFYAKEKIPGSPAYFSSVGTSWRGDLKPNINAPGWNILSTVPMPWQTGVKSGTSMSAPLLAGVVALYRSAYPKATPEEIRSAMMLSATPTRGLNTSNELATVMKQGAGTVNATKMLELTTRTYPQYFALRDAAHFEGTHRLVISNVGKDAQTYHFGHKRAQCLYALHKGAPTSGDKDEGLWDLRPEQCPDETSLYVVPSSVRVAPGKSATVTVHIKPPSWSPRLKMYSGWLLINSSCHKGSGVVPYGGTGGDLQAIAPFDRTFKLWNTTLPALFDASLNEQIQNDTTTFHVNSSVTSWPAVVWSSSVSPPLATCDLVRANLDFHPTEPIVEAPSKFGSLFNFPGVPDYGSSKRAIVHTSDVPIVGRYFNYSWLLSRDSSDDNHRRSWYTFSFCNIAPQLHNLSSNYDLFNVTEGHYRALLRIKHVYASDESDLEDQFDSYLSHAFYLKVNYTDLVEGHGDLTGGKEAKPGQPGGGGGGGPGESNVIQFLPPPGHEI